MRRVLITGKNSYVGTSLEKWLGNYPYNYSVDSISLRNDSWKETDFSVFDVVFYVAGIAHIKETKKNTSLYYKVNCDLAYDVAQKSKNEGVKQFIYLSSMSVYGMEKGIIDKNTPTKPRNTYGKSKLQAEELIMPLENNRFKVAIVRPPMIYGKNCRGNYSKLANLVLKIPIFPKIENKRSMIYVDNFSEFIRLLIDDGSGGLFFPQNKEYVSTTEMVDLIAEVHDTNLRMTKLFNLLLRCVKSSKITKLFGDLIYEKQMSEFKETYTIYDLKTSIRLTEKEK